MRRTAILSGSIGAMIGVFVARMLLESGPGLGLLFLLAVPIAAVTLEFGVRAGGAAAIAAAMGVVTHAEVAYGEVDPMSVLTRCTVYAVTVFLAARAGDRDRAAVAPMKVVAAAPPQLTPRELEVLRLVACGHTNREIAEQLVLSVRTVEAHRARLQAKIGCSGRAELFRFAREHDLIPTTARGL